jgi:Co/Zn/Cd efflux system component
MSDGPARAGDFDGMIEADRRRIVNVVSLNLAMFFAEALAGQIAGSQSLQADALDFLACGASCGLSLWAIGRPAPARAAAAIIKGGGFVVMGLWVAVTTLYHFLVSAPPDASTMGLIGVLALGANAYAVWLLSARKGNDINIGAAWQGARNNIIGNAAVIIAAGLVAILGSGAPDLIVAGVIVALFLASAFPMLRQALDGWRELKEADAFPRGQGKDENGQNQP